MVSSTIYTIHSSSFLTTRIVWRKRICVGCSFHGWLFKDWPFDYHDSGAFRTGLGVVACSSHNKVTTTTPSIIQISMHWICLRWRSRMVMIWCFDNKSPISIHIFCHSSLMDNCWAWMMFAFIFVQLDDLELLSTFLRNHIWLWYNSLLWNFWLPLYSHSVLHDYCSIEAALLQ